MAIFRLYSYLRKKRALNKLKMQVNIQIFMLKYIFDIFFLNHKNFR